MCVCCTHRYANLITNSIVVGFEIRLNLWSNLSQSVSDILRHRNLGFTQREKPDRLEQRIDGAQRYADLDQVAQNHWRGRVQLRPCDGECAYSIANCEEQARHEDAVFGEIFVKQPNHFLTALEQFTGGLSFQMPQFREQRLTLLAPALGRIT